MSLFKNLFFFQTHWEACIISMGLVQERRNSSVLAMELNLSCTNPPICSAKTYLKYLIAT